MRKLATVLVGLSLMAGTGCSSLSVIAYTVDEESSGKTREQVVDVAFIGQGSESGPSDDSTGTALPSPFAKMCDATGLGVKELGTAVFTAAGQLAFDALTSAIDSRRKRLAKAAVHPYGATAIVPVLRMDAESGDTDDPSAFIRTACIHVTRHTESKLAMQAVFIVERVLTRSAEARHALTLTPAYIRVDLAGAQTRAYPSGRTPEIELSGSVGISAVEIDPRTGHPDVSMLTNSPFSLGALELKKGYANPLFVGEKTIEDNGWTELKVPRGPMFRPLRDSPTVGGVSVAVVETGGAASLDAPGALEKSIRATTRALIGKAIETRLAE